MSEIVPVSRRTLEQLIQIAPRYQNDLKGLRSLLRHLKNYMRRRDADREKARALYLRIKKRIEFLGDQCNDKSIPETTTTTLSRPHGGKKEVLNSSPKRESLEAASG